MAKITVHKALADLKLYKKKIESKLQSSKFVGFKVGQSGKVGSITEDEFVKEAKSSYESLLDSFNKIVELKRLIVESNSKTFVTVGGKEMTVADAIVMKDLIKEKASIYSVFSSQLRLNESAVNVKNEKVDEEIEKMVSNKDTDKGKENNLDSIYSTLREIRYSKLVDPLSASTVCEQLRTEVDTFNSEVDAVLSVSNAVTLIEVPW